MTENDKRPIRQQLKDQLESKQLSEQQLAQLQALFDSRFDSRFDSTGEKPPAAKPANETARSPSSAGRNLWSQWMFSWRTASLVAACAGLILVAVLLIPGLPGTAPTPIAGQTHPLLQAIADEVVYNHLKQEPLQVHSGRIEDIQQALNKLSFTPVNSQLMAAAEFETLGARYCSIQGIKAAQIRVLKAGQPASQTDYQTVYQARYEKSVFDRIPNLASGKPQIAKSQGIEVKIWTENDILFAATGNKKRD